jgi:hypothetical protein
MAILLDRGGVSVLQRPATRYFYTISWLVGNLKLSMIVST